jgi:hypothetical protein
MKEAFDLITLEESKKIASAKYVALPDGKLWIQYADGEVRIFDVYDYISKNRLDTNQFYKEFI